MVGNFAEKLFLVQQKGYKRLNCAQAFAEAFRHELGYLDQYMAEQPEAFLEYCDGIGIPMQAYPISLDRPKS
jgi:hypothetical protein